MKIAHLTTVDLSLRYLVLPQLEAALEFGESIGISAPGPFVAELEERGIRHIPLNSSTRGMNPLADMRSTVELWRILKREDIDVLHTHNPKPGLYGRVLGRLAGVPIVVNTVHGLYATPESPFLKRIVVYALEAVASRFSDAELVQSNEDLELLTKLRIFPRAKTFLLGNGVDLVRFNPGVSAAVRAEVRSELGVGQEQVVVGMVGRLVAEKGIPELIEAASRIDGDVVFMVVGPHDPEKSDALPDELLARGEEAGIRFLGMRTDVERLYGGFDLFVLPSHREGFPRAAMEAAASGLPVIATDIRGCRQVVAPGSNGLLFEKGDVDGLVEAVEQLVRDSDTRLEMGSKSATKATAEFDENDVVRRVIGTYADVAERKGMGWNFAANESTLEIREASIPDAKVVAELHSRMIATGFLSSLGNSFLSLLYRSLIRSDKGVVFVADDGDGPVGFIAGTTDTSAFYREFLKRSWFLASLLLVPVLLRPSNVKRVLETLRHGSDEHRADAELLSMAVAPRAQRRGLGHELVSTLLTWAGSRVSAVKVVVGSDNQPAISLYEGAGFGSREEIEVHAGAPSLEMIWHS